jgi:hypothetical protein
MLRMTKAKSFYLLFMYPLTMHSIKYDLGMTNLYGSSERKKAPPFLLVLRMTQANYSPFLNLLGIYSIKSWANFDFESTIPMDLQLVSIHFPCWCSSDKQGKVLTISAPCWHVIDEIWDELWSCNNTCLWIMFLWIFSSYVPLFS